MGSLLCVATLFCVLSTERIIAEIDNWWWLCGCWWWLCWQCVLTCVSAGLALFLWRIKFTRLNYGYSTVPFVIYRPHYTKRMLSFTRFKFLLSPRTHLHRHCYAGVARGPYGPDSRNFSGICFVIIYMVNWYALFFYRETTALWLVSTICILTHGYKTHCYISLSIGPHSPSTKSRSLCWYGCYSRTCFVTIYETTAYFCLESKSSSALFISS